MQYIELRPIHDLIDNVAAKEAVKDYLKGYCEEFRAACVPPHIEEAGGTVTNAKQVIAVNIKGRTSAPFLFPRFVEVSDSNCFNPNNLL